MRGHQSRLGFACLVLISAAGCRSTVDVPVSIRIEAPYDEGDIFIHLGTGECPSVTELDGLPTSRLTPGESIDLPADTRAAAVWVLAGDCSIVAFGCDTLRGTEAIVIDVTAADPISRCDGLCDGAECVGSLDAGRDMGGEDTSTPDAGEDTAVDAAGCERDEVLGEGDEDGDGLSNTSECCVTDDCELQRCVRISECVERDGDGDSVPDYLDASVSLGALGDADGDGLSNAVECCAPSEECCDGSCDPDECLDSDADGTPDYLDLDSDDDGIDDEEECLGMELPDCLSMLGEDGLPPFRDIDTDDDGVVDSSEDEETRFQPDECLPASEETTCDLCACGSIRNFRCVLDRCEPQFPITATADSSCLAPVSPWLVSSTRAYRVGDDACEAPGPSVLDELPGMEQLDRSEATCRIGLCLWQFHIETRPRRSLSAFAASSALSFEQPPVYALSHSASAEMLRRLFPDEMEGLSLVSLSPRGFGVGREERPMELGVSPRVPTQCFSGSCP